MAFEKPLVFISQDNRDADLAKHLANGLISQCRNAEDPRSSLKTYLEPKNRS